MRRAILCLSLLLSLVAPCPADPDPEQVLIAGLSSEVAAERVLAITALVELGRLDPLKARQQTLLADPSPRVRAETLVALAGSAPSEALVALANKWLALYAPRQKKKKQIRDAQFIVAALLAELDSKHAARAAALGKSFPQDLRRFDYWFTGHGPFQRMTRYPDRLIGPMRAIALRWLAGEGGPARWTFANALLTTRDPAFLEAVNTYLQNKTAKRRFDLAGMLLRRHKAMHAQRKAELLKIVSTEGEKLLAKQRPIDQMMTFRTMAELGVRGLRRRLFALARQLKLNDPIFGWFETEAPWAALARAWPRAQRDNIARGYVARGMMRAAPDKAKPLLLALLETKLYWGVVFAMHGSGKLTAADKKQLGQTVQQHMKGGFRRGGPMHDFTRCYAVAADLELPGLVKSLTESKWAGADSVLILYKLAAKTEARAMARRVFKKHASWWTDRDMSARVTLTVVLCEKDPELARTLLPSILAESLDQIPRKSLLKFGSAEPESVHLQRAAAAVVLARTQDAGAAKLLGRIQRDCRGWRRYRAAVWHKPELATWAVKARAKAKHLQRLPLSIALTGYKVRPTWPGEQAWIAAVLASHGDKSARGPLIERLGELKGEVRRVAVRALGKVGAPEDRKRLVALSGDALLQAEVQVALTRLGDPRARVKLTQLLRQAGPERLIAAYGLLSTR